MLADEIGFTFRTFFKKRFEFYRNAMRFLHNKLPVQVNYYYFLDIKKYIESIYHHYDLLFPVLIRTAEYAIDKNVPKILELTDSIGINYKKSKLRTVSLKWKIIYHIETERLLAYERRCLSNFDKVLFVNAEEMQYFAMPQKSLWMPNGVDDKLLCYNKMDSKYKNWVVFFGKMNYQPNIDAVVWFIKNVLGHLNKGITFGIVGADPPLFIKKLEKRYHNIVVTGYVDDPYKILKSCLCVVAPMQSGGGIQNKILESMALGTVNIVSSLAAKPIGGQNKEDFLVLDSPQEIADTLNDIFADPIKYQPLKLKSRTFINNRFTWVKYEGKLLSLVDSVLRKSL